MVNIRKFKREYTNKNERISPFVFLFLLSAWGGGSFGRLLNFLVDIVLTSIISRNNNF